jgi:small subunit ribosomal protein S20
MPQLKAAKKDLRKNQRRRNINDRRRLSIHKTVRTVQEAINNKDKKAANAALPKAQAALDRAARHNVIHPNKAARKKSRLLKAITKIK